MTKKTLREEIRYLLLEMDNETDQADKILKEIRKRANKEFYKWFKTSTLPVEDWWEEFLKELR